MEKRSSLLARAGRERRKTASLEEECSDVRVCLARLARALCGHVSNMPDKRVEKTLEPLSAALKNLCNDESGEARLAGLEAVAAFARIPHYEASMYCPSLTRAAAPHLSSPGVRLAALQAVSEAIVSDPASLRHALGALESCCADRNLAVREAIAHVVGGSLANLPPFFAPPNHTTAAKLLPLMLVGLTDETCEVWHPTL